MPEPHPTHNTQHKTQNQPHRFAVLVAGGSGSRMGSAVPKQFLPLAGKPVLQHTLEVFAEAMPGIALLLVLPAEQQESWEQLCRNYGCRVPHQVVTGGRTRFESVRNGLAAISVEQGLVAVHDGVRPLVPASVIQESFRVAAEKGSAVAAVPLKDSVREVLPDGRSQALDRSRYRLVQTPQTFQLSLLRTAFAKAAHADFTDDAAVAEAAGHQITLVEGSYRNIKITTPEDLLLAGALLMEGLKD